MISFLFFISPILFITLNPVVWKNKLGDYNSKMFVFSQVGRFLFGIFYIWFVKYIMLVDITFAGWLSNVLWVIGVIMLFDITYFNDNKSVSINGGIGIALIIFIVIWGQMLYPIIKTKDFAQLPNVEIIDGRQQAMDEQHIIIVPLETAQYKGEKLMSGVEDYYYYTIGDYTKQKINDELYWIAPIEYGGYFKASNAEKITTYIKISAEDKDAPAELIEEYNMTIVPSAYFNEDLYRYIRNKYPNIWIMEASFEPDDNGYPWYAVTYGKPYKFRNGPVVEGVIMLDPQTGESKKYTLNNVPKFVDQVIPANVAEKYNHYFGEYKHGWWNMNFAQRDIHVPTKWGSGEEVIGIYSTDGNFKWFTDHTVSSNESNTMVGYTLMDGRTGKMKFYKSEQGLHNGLAALQKVETTFNKEEWSGTNPLLYNIYGEETWVIPVIDNYKSLREIALVNAESGEIVHGKTKREVLEKYKVYLATRNQGNMDPTNVAIYDSVTGNVTGIYNVSTNMGETITTTYYIMIEGREDIYSILLDTSPYVGFTKEGDTVRIQYVNNEQNIKNAQYFYNITQQIGNR